MSWIRTPCAPALAVVLLILGLSAGGPAAEPILKGYADYAAMRTELQGLAKSSDDMVKLESLGTTLGGRDVLLVKIGRGKMDEKPAILVVGNVEPAHLLGSELAMRIARHLAQKAGHDPQIDRLLDRVTFYLIPRPAPAACEAFFRKPYRERSANERLVDDDHDGQIDEDGPDDLDGDGLITMMRVEDPSGEYKEHPDDPRVLVRAKREQNEQGRWRLLVEGRDDDHDEQFNEDPPGGVEFNRNFPFRYPYYEPQAGPFAVSEVETKAVADFAYDHPNIALVLSFTPEDNLMHPWKPAAANDGDRIKTAVQAADAPLLEHVGKLYQETVGAKDPPESPAGRGSFSPWVYFHYGRWSLGCRGWWIPKVPAKTAKPSKPEGGETKKGDGEARRGADQINALRWFAREKIDGFVPWKRITHPDFPGKRVEVGGFKPFLRDNPPAGQLDGLADKHWTFLAKLADLLPRLAIAETKVEPLGSGVYRLAAVVVNQGYLPTMSRMGSLARQPHPLQIAVELPKGAALVTGSPRTELPVLAGRGGRAEHVWLISAGPKPAPLRVRAWSQSVGEASATVELKKNPK